MKNDHTIRTLEELISMSRDGEEGFRACAQHALAQELCQLCLDRSREYADGTEELRSLVRQLGGEPGNRASPAGTLHRRWVNIRAALARGDDAAILAECERGEDHALETYRNALDDHLPDFVRRVVLRQFEAAMSNRDQVRALHDWALHGAAGRDVGASSAALR